MNAVIMLLSAAWIITLGILIYAIYRYIKYTDKRTEKIKAGKNTISIFNSIYKFFLTIPIVKKEIISVRKRLYDNFLLQDEILKYKAALYYATSWIVGIVLFLLVCIFYRNNNFQIVILSIFCYYLRSVVLDQMIGDDTNLLSGLIEYIDDLKNDYQLKEDIDEAVEDAKLESGNYLVVKHIENMKEAIDEEDNLEEYMEDCPNEYLKLIALNCNMTREYGDTPLKEEESAFVANLNYTSKLISIELDKRIKLKYWLGSAALLCILPLLAFTPFEWWVDTKLPILNSFYYSSWGFILKIFITITLITFFFIVRKFTSTEVKLIKEKKFYWEENLLKLQSVNKFIKLLTPKEGSKGFYMWRNLINKSQVNTKIEWIQIQRIVLFIISFIFCISMAFAIHSINKNTILSNISSSESLGIADGGQVDTNKVEDDFIKDFGIENVKKMSSYEIMKKLNVAGKYDDTTIKSISKGINNKIILINNEYVRWYEVLICLLLSFFISQIPKAYLLLKIKTNEFGMYSEVMIYETLILILMNYDNTTTYLILDYMSKFGKIFKNNLDQTIYTLQEGTVKVLSEIIKDDTEEIDELEINTKATQLHETAINDFQNTAAEEALNQLIERVDFKPFKNLIKNLMKAEDIPVKYAFSSLSAYRDGHAKKREDDNNKIITRRIEIGNLLSIASILIVVSLYIALPFAIVSTQQLDTIQQKVPTSNNY